VEQWTVIVSAPYMLPCIDRFRPLFKDEGIKIITPEVHERLSEAELLPLIAQADGVICGDDRFTKKVLLAAKKLKVISKWGTGIDSIDSATCKELGIRVCRTPNAFTEPVADTVLACMLSFARRTPWMDRAMKRGKWNKIPGTSLGEKTLGIIGVGDIGKAVAKRAHAFGMTILGTDPKPMPKEFLQSTKIKMVTRDELLQQADFVSLNCDLNATSIHLMSDRQFSQMKPGSYLINTARGPIVDEPALVRALRAKRIAGAALDVFEVEPLPEDSPLKDMENVLLAPHNSNSSPRAWEHVHQNTIKNLLAGLREVQR
jgi:D-3-phosphoglycerate dehydrogenase